MNLFWVVAREKRLFQGKWPIYHQLQRATFQVTNFKVATSQVFNFPSGNFSKVMLGPLIHRRLLLGTYGYC